MDIYSIYEMAGVAFDNDNKVFNNNSFLWSYDVKAPTATGMFRFNKKIKIIKRADSAHIKRKVSDFKKTTPQDTQQCGTLAVIFKFNEEGKDEVGKTGVDDTIKLRHNTNMSLALSSLFIWKRSLKNDFNMNIYSFQILMNEKNLNEIFNIFHLEFFICNYILFCFSVYDIL